MRKNITNTTQKILLLLFLLSLVFHGFAADLYVSNSGNDSNNGTISTPLLTIQAALNVATAGDVIYVRTGTYAEKLWWPNSGSAGNPITLTNYNGEVAVLSGVNAINPTQGAFILLSSISHVRINGLVFKDNIMNYADGVYVTGTGTDIHVTNCEFDNIGWTSSKTTFPSPSNSAHAIIFVGSTATSISDVYIGGNYIHDCITGYSESMTIAGNVETFLIEGNTLDNNTNIGIDAAGHFTWTGAPANVNFARSGIIKNNVVSNYAGPAALDAAGGIYTDGGSFITIENNLVYNYKVGYSVGCEVPGNANTGNIVRNNIAYDCSLSGLFLGSNTTSMVNNTQVYNNTFYQCGTGVFDNGQIALQNSSGNDIRNNIFYPTDGRLAMVQMGGTTSTNNTISYNLFWRDNANTTNLFFNVSGVVNSVLADPLFVNATANNFHLSSSSPAIDAGDPTYNPGSSVFDMDGQTRVLNGRVDIGADESGSTGPNISVTGVSVSPSSTSLSIGSTQALSALVSPNNASNPSVSWSSSNTSIATVNSSGLVTAQNTGTATITATTVDGGFTDTSVVTVSGGNSGGPVSITIDGNTGDWSGIPSLATGSGQGAVSMKVAEGSDHIYVLVEGSSLTTGISRLLINSDNNSATGLAFYDAWASAGVDYMIESELQYRSTGTGWSWLGLSNTFIDLVKTASVYEISIEKSSILNLQIPFKIGFTLDANVAQLPQNSWDLALFEGNVGGGSTLPSPWVTDDIGAVGAVGSADFSNGIFDVEGSGSDIWNTADEFRFVYQPITGDVEITARVVSIENTNNWAKAGVMIRESLTTGSRHAMSIIASTAGASFQRRTTTNGSSAHSTTGSISDPYWVRMVRVGNTFTSYYSADGNTWVSNGSVNISMNTQTYIGLVATSHNDGVLCSASFSDVSVSIPNVGSSAPEAGKTYYIDNPYHDLRLAANGSEDAYTTSTSTTGANVEWTVTTSPTGGYYYLDCNGGGSKPRIRTDQTSNADMQPTSSAGSWTRWSFSDAGDGAYYFTTLASGNFRRLQVNSSGEVKMVTTASADIWEEFTFTEVTSSIRILENADLIGGTHLEPIAIHLYPVPVNNQLNISLDEYEHYQSLEIIDVSGKVLLKHTDISKSEMALDVTDLLSGIYFLRIYESDALPKVIRFTK